MKFSVSTVWNTLNVYKQMVDIKLNNESLIGILETI